MISKYPESSIISFLKQQKYLQLIMTEAYLAACSVDRHLDCLTPHRNPRSPSTQ